MTTASQLAAERYPDTAIPSVLSLPHPPVNADDCVRYIRQLHTILNQSQARLAEVLRILSYHRSTVSTDADTETGDGTQITGGTATMPAATESGVQHVDYNVTTEQARFFVDGADSAGDPKWYEVGVGPWSSRTVGFEDRDDSELTWTDGTLKLEINPTGTDFSFWVDGIKFVSTGDFVTITDTEGMWYIYYDSDGDLVATQVATLETLIQGSALVAIVYWDADNNTAVFVGDERHGLMDPDVHYYLHEAFGTTHISGLTLGDILSDASGALDAHAELSVASGEFDDEDIHHQFPGAAAPAEIPIIYKTGATPVWRKKAATTAPIYFDTGVPQYNSYSAPNWGLSSIANTKFFLMHIIATNDYRDAHKIVALLGEAQYNTIGEAQTGAEQEISDIYTGGLPMPEFLILGTVIFQYATSYTNSYDCRIRATAEGDDYINWLQQELSPGTAPTSHSLTTGRDLPNQHPADAVSTDTSAFGGVLSAADDEVQAALDTLDDHLHDSDYVSIVNPAVAGNFPALTAGGELTDSGYDETSFATAAHDHDADYSPLGHDHDSDYLALSGGTLTGDLQIGDSTNVDLIFHDGTSPIAFMNYSPSGYFQLGTGGGDCAILFDKILTISPIQCDSYLSWRNFADSANYPFVKLDTGNRFVMEASYPTYHGNYAGGNYWLAATDGDIHQYGTGIISNATRVETPEVRSREHRATATCALLNNTNKVLVRVDLSNTEAVGLMIHYNVVIRYTIFAATHYFTETGLLMFTCVDNAGTVTKTSAIVGATNVNTGAGTCAISTTTGSGTNWGQVYIKAYLSAGGTFVSSKCDYHVLNTDVSNTALSSWA